MPMNTATLEWSAYTNVKKNKIYTIASDISEQKRLLGTLDQTEKARLVKTQPVVNEVQLQTDIQIDGQIKGSEIELEQAFMRLLHNALDAVAQLETKWIKVTIAESKDVIIVSVADSGHGVPQEVQERVFAPLFYTRAQHRSGFVYRQRHAAGASFIHHIGCS